MIQEVSNNHQVCFNNQISTFSMGPSGSESNVPVMPDKQMAD
eukprot:CAMPEP_0170553864 /NCGR_PEP_ID=MMETSP0211-20121228/11698_1 /TAXON_ID=311385 /ORGANISM="Pseudokeronopsis sp., Strain OXSARD2" /LENGTH=41 /DNA_ID= /DNA_START= /DNA_END= /DNA_ORIENTATION=